MLVALVQGVVSTFHKHLAPFNNACRQETGDRAKDDLLEKRGVHGSLDSSAGAKRPSLPEAPLFCFHDP